MWLGFATYNVWLGFATYNVWLGFRTRAVTRKPKKIHNISRGGTLRYLQCVVGIRDLQCVVGIRYLQCVVGISTVRHQKNTCPWRGAGLSPHVVALALFKIQA